MLAELWRTAASELVYAQRTAGELPRAFCYAALPRADRRSVYQINMLLNARPIWPDVNCYIAAGASRVSFCNSREFNKQLKEAGWNADKMTCRLGSTHFVNRVVRLHLWLIIFTVRRWASVPGMIYPFEMKCLFSRRWSVHAAVIWNYWRARRMTNGSVPLTWRSASTVCV